MSNTRFLWVLTAFIVITGIFHSSAQAADSDEAFEINNIVVSIYNETDNEIGIDLGPLETVISYDNEVVIPAGTFSLDDFEVISSWSDVRVGVWGMVDPDELTQTYCFATTLTTAKEINLRQSSNFVNSTFSVYGVYDNAENNKEGNIGVSVISASNVLSYDTALNMNSSSPGVYGNIINTDYTGTEEGIMSGFETLGYVDMYLYRYGYVVENGAYVMQAIGSGGNDYAALIRLMADGSIVVNPAQAVNTISIESVSATPSSVGEGDEVQLTGSASDTLSDTLSYEWSQTDSSGVTVDFSQSPSNDPTWTFSAPEVSAETTLIFELTVSDNSGNSETSEAVSVTVNVVDNSPVADAGEDQSCISIGSTITLDGSGSADDVEIISYSWTQTGGDTVTISDAESAQATVDLTGYTGGDLTFQLTVSDGVNGDVSDTMTVYIAAIAEASASSTNVSENSDITLSGDGSSTSSGATYLWSCSDSGVTIDNSDTSTAERTVAAPSVSSGGSTVTFTLTVTKAGSCSATDTVDVTVSNVNQSPLITTISSPGSVDEGETFSLTASVSDDEDIMEDSDHITWELDGETLLDEHSLTLSYTAPDLTYTEPSKTLSFTLAVTDSDGQTTESDPVIVTVNFINHQPMASMSCTSCNEWPDGTYNAGDTLSFSASYSSDEDSDTGNNDIASFAWDLRNAGGTSVETRSGESYNLTLPQSAGTYTLILTVTDHDGATDTETATFDVVNTSGPNPVIDAADEMFETTTLSLDGSASTDSDGVGTEGIASWSWSCVPAGMGNFSDSTGVSTTFTANRVSVDTDNISINLTLTGTDGIEATRSHNLTIINNTPPNAPGTNNPRYDSNAGTYSPDNGEVASLLPEISVNNVTDTDGHDLTYSFKLATSASFNAVIAEANGISQGNGTTTWHVTAEDFISPGITELSDETVYYIWASASDGIADLEDEIIWSEATVFFVNLSDDEPGTSIIRSPENEEEIHTTTPLFEISPVTDQDMDELEYQFRLYEIADSSIDYLATGNGTLAEGSECTNASSCVVWEPQVNLEENVLYFWQVRVQDINTNQIEREWQDEQSFYVNTEMSTPSAPSIISPESNASIDTRTPSLEVETAVDLDPNDTDELLYYIEIVEQGLGGECTDDVFDCPDDGDCSLVLSGALEIPWTNAQLPSDSEIFWEESSEETLGVITTTGTVTVGGFTNSFVWTPSDDIPGFFLKDNTSYCWRVRAEDPDLETSPWAVSEFFVNTENDPPDIPEILSPRNGAIVKDTEASIILSVYETQDLDGDSLFYDFELFDDTDSAPIAEKTIDTCTEDESLQVTACKCAIISKQNLTQGATYTWHAQARDPYDATNGWSSWFTFRYYEDYPPRPEIVSPLHGTVVNTLTPSLTVTHPESMDQDDVTYTFELFADKKLNYPVASISLDQGDGSTTWNLSSALTDWHSSYPAHRLKNNVSYYWRVRSSVSILNNGTYSTEPSSPTSTYRFTVNVDVDVYDVVVATDAVIDVDSEEAETILTVTDTSFTIYGFSLTVPHNNFREDTTVSIGYLTDTTLFPESLVSSYPAFELTPSDQTFENLITLTIPWSMEAIPGASADATAVDLYRYETDTGIWEWVDDYPISSIANDTISFSLNHFSYYAVGVKAQDVSSDDDDDSGGGGGGCFISTTNK